MNNSLPRNSVINTRNFKKVSMLLNYFKHGNCWGTTLFLLGKQKHRRAIHGFKMNDFLQENTRLVKKAKVGDILVLRYSKEYVAKRIEGDYFNKCLKSNLLAHTAIYIGKDKYLHQVGYFGPIQIHSLKQIARIYYSSTKIEIARIKHKKNKQGSK